MIVADAIEAAAFAVWCYVRIVRTNWYPSQSGKSNWKRRS